MSDLHALIEEPEANHPWTNHDLTYRAKEVRILSQWILTGASGSVIGLGGSGKSDLLGFLCHRPEALNDYLPAQGQPVMILPMDLNTLPAGTLSALFRVILRTFYEHRHRFPPQSQEVITNIYLENRGHSDPFLSQSGLRELLLHLQQKNHRIVFALDRFDALSTVLTSEMGDNLRGLRNGFKETLSYIAYMNHGLAYLPNPEAFGDLKRLLDQQSCVIGPMNEKDTRDTIARRVAVVEAKPTEEEVRHIWHLTGGYPSLVMLACRWWLTTSTRPPLEKWLDTLMQQENVRHRLEDIWAGLTQEEQLVITEVHKASTSGPSLQQEIGKRYRTILDELLEKGLCLAMGESWSLFCALFAEHVANVGGFSRGKIWLDRDSQALYHGQDAMDDLTPKERAILHFLAPQPYARHSYTDIILAAWTEEERYHGVTNDSLYQVIRTLRQKIEPIPSKPVYVVNWRGKPEGGYQFFPEGKPQ